MDTPRSMSLADTHAGLHDVRYRFTADAEGSIEPWATPDGLEHLARHFLEIARTNGEPGYHVEPTPARARSS